MIYIENKKRKLERLETEYPDAIILDVTSQSQYESAKQLSPFYPHGNIPIPFSNGLIAMSVESIWQGLKVFERADVDRETFQKESMSGIKRTIMRNGRIIGHRRLDNDTILSYFDARVSIYLPAYKWVLENIDSVKNAIEKIAAKSKVQDIVLLDYNTNTEFRDISKPLSHAGLIKLYIEGRYPDGAPSDYAPLTADEVAQISEQKKLERKIRLNNKQPKK